MHHAGTLGLQLPKVQVYMHIILGFRFIHSICQLPDELELADATMSAIKGSADVLYVVGPFHFGELTHTAL